MKRIFSITFIILLFSGIAVCKKSNQNQDKNPLLLFGLLLTQNSSACNPQSGFTICIPKGIAE